MGLTNKKKRGVSEDSGKIGAVVGAASGAATGYTESCATNPSNLPPLVLAYIGDAVFELYVRILTAKEFNRPLKELHRHTVALVRASSQARMAHAIEPILEPDEHDVWRRARNAKSSTHPRSADVLEYRHSTAFEAVLGYLHLCGRTERLQTLLRAALKEAVAQDEM